MCLQENMLKWCGFREYFLSKLSRISILNVQEVCKVRGSRLMYRASIQSEACAHAPT